MKPRDYLYGCVILLTVVRISRQKDPCKTARPFPDLKQRLPSNKVAAKTCLQDTYIDEGWYGEPGVKIPTEQPDYLHCGTVYPAYIHNFVINPDVSNPSNYDDAIIYVKVPYTSTKLFTIKTKLCDDSYRVYNLARIPYTCSSYCVVPLNAKGIPTYTTPVAVTVELTEQRLVFNCNFQQSTDVLWYEVTWYINNLPMHTTQPVKTSRKLKDQTALHEQQIIDSGTDKVGFKVKCSFRAGFSRKSSLGLPTSSYNKFIGIEIITPTVYLDLNTNKPAELEVRATAPIACPNSRPGCQLHVNVVNFNLKTCESIPKLSKCRMEVDTNKRNSTETLKVNADGINMYGSYVTTRIIGLKTNGYLGHRIWGNAVVGEIKVKISQSTERIEGKSCSTVTDPHVKPFSGQHQDDYYYLETVYATFTLFRNKELEQEIQIKTEPCHHGVTERSGSCTCGLALRAGRQVYEFNRCGNRARWDIGYTLCGEVEGIFDVRVNGNSFEITFSSKTMVHIDINNHFLDVHIYPSNLDYGHADGLCGTIEVVNGAVFQQRNKERPPLDSYTSSFSKSWRVPPGEINLFNTEEFKYLTRALYPVYPCNCPKYPTEYSSLTCTDKKQPKNCATVRKFRKSRTCKVGSRTKRRAIGQLNQNQKPHKIEKREAPFGWRNGWTEEKAKSYCLELFNRSKAVKLCADVPNVDQTGSLAICILDIKLTGDTGFASASVESVKNKCYHELDSNTTLQESTPETPSIFQQIQEVACVNECSDRGNCTNGTCNCDDDYGGDDCSVNIRDAPTVDSIDNDGYCTLNDNCKEISVYGQTFLDTGNTYCKVRAEEMFENGVIQDAGEYKHQAYVESISEAICTLPKSRKKKSTVVLPEESSVKVYYVSVTNDGNAYSNNFPIVVFNSVCQYCKIDGVKVDCSIMKSYCVSGTGCYSNGESLVNNDCYTCFVNGTSSAWIYSEAYRCQDPTTTQGLGTSTNADTTTTHVPVSSTNADTTTTQGPGTSTNADTTTTQGPDTSTNADTTTTQGPDTSTNADTTTTQGPDTSTNADTTTTQGPDTSANAKSRPPVSSIKADPTLNHHVSVSEESRPLWIIGVVLGVAALICLLAFALICKRKMMKIKKYNVASFTIDLKKGDSSPPPSYTNQAYMYKE